MVLAAGLGTRLRPLTNDRPKALVELAGKTLLEFTLARLRNFGVREVVVNVHHFADKVVAYLREHDNFGMTIHVSREDEQLLDTGGGLKKAAQFLAGDEPFVLHNVDIVSDIDLAEMVRAHRERGPLATLAVQQRNTSRYLLFDDEMKLCGRRKGVDGEPELVRQVQDPVARAFAGIHVISPRIFDLLSEEGAFPIIDAYLRLVREGQTIAAFNADGFYWRDLGTAQSLEAAEQDVASGKLSI